MIKLLALIVIVLTVTSCATSKPPPYAPQLYDYLAAVDEMIGGDETIRASLTSKFEIVSIMYWLDISLKSEPSSSSSFIEYSSKTPIVVYSVAHVEDAANELLQMFAAIATDETHPKLVDDLIGKPTDAEVFLICRIGVAAIKGLSNSQKSLLPSEPMCPTVIADYRENGSESELGFLGHISENFHLALSPGSGSR